MSKRPFLGAAIVLLTSSAAPALALDNVVVGNGHCNCMCETANTGWYGEYDSRGYGCGALEGKTCNIENPQTGLIETGRLWGCGPTPENLQSSVPLNGVLDPGSSGPTFGRPGVAAPLNGVFGQ